MQSNGREIKTCWHQMAPVLQQIGNPAAPVVEETTAPPKPANLRDAFTALVSGGVERTGFKRERIESFLPDELKQLFRSASTPGSRINDDPLSQRLMTFLKDELFGILPDYNAKALPEHAKGFQINGRAAKILMSRDIALRQMRALTKNMDVRALIKRAEVDLKGDFSPSEISDIAKGSGNRAIDRVLVAKMVIIANELNPK